MYLTELTRRLCTQDLYPFVLQNKKKLIWTISKSHHLDFLPDSDELVTSRTIRAVWKYIAKFQSLPIGPQAVRNYVVTNPDHVKEFSRGEGEGKDETVGVLDQLDKLEAWEPPVESLKSMDTLVLLETVFSRVRGGFHETNAGTYSKIAQGTEAHKWREGGALKEERGPAAAIRWMRAQWQQDYSEETPIVDGIMHENMQIVRDGFADRLKDQATTGKFPLGLRHVDNAVIVGKRNLRFIGIVGMAGDGKTTLTNYIVYNWLLNGAHGLYVSTEHSPQEIWDVMTYLHSSHSDYQQRRLPPIRDWENRTVSNEDAAHLNQITDDIENRINLPGLLDVKSFTTRDWDTIIDYLTINFKKNKYDFLVIDYMSRLDVPGDSRYRDKAVGEMIHGAQKLTRNFDDSRGLIILTPIQITKAAYEDTMKGKFEEGQGHYNINCIRQYSEFVHDGDLLLTVWSDAKMKETNEIEIACIKKRKGSQPPAVRMFLEPETGILGYDKAYGVPEERTAPNSEALHTATQITDIGGDLVDELVKEKA